MKKTILTVLAVAVALGGFAFYNFDGMGWMASTGLLGEEAGLRSHVTDYWQARVEEDIETMEMYSHPEQGGAYASGMLLTESYEVLDVTIDGDTALAEVYTVSHLKHPLLSASVRETTMKETWVKLDGAWVRELMPMTMSDVVRSYRETLDDTLYKRPGQAAPGSE